MIGFTCGTYDLLHVGHLHALQIAKSQCDYLIVGLQTDPSIDRKDKNKPVQSVLERYIQLVHCPYVDEIYVYETEKDLENLLGLLDINKRFLGADWEDKDFTGRELCLKKDIECIFTSRHHNYSSSELRNRCQI